MKPDAAGPINAYADEIAVQLSTGHAREHGYRPELERLMKTFPNTNAVNDPKRSEHGNPDFIFLKKSNNQIILGYAEAKDIDVDLDKTEDSEQMRRYSGYGNLYLTNYLEFRFFRNGDKYGTVQIGALKGGRVEFYPESFQALQVELQAFLEQPPEIIRSGTRLAQIMGAKALRIRNNVIQYLEQGVQGNNELVKIYRMMKTLLVHDLGLEQFADMYAQTLVYGLFVARYNAQSGDGFNRKEARDLVPASNPFLREFFDHIVGPHFDTRLAYIVDELCEVFSVSDVRDIVHKHLKVTDTSNDGKDPIIHFYEDFLKAYDPDERKKMGAYYTPTPVVRFIVRNVDEVLKRDFGLAKGLADTSKKTIMLEHGQQLQVRDKASGRLKKTTSETVEVHAVQILDPAVGTATFLNEIVKHIHEGFLGQEGRWPSYVEADLLPRMYGFELMMAPYTIAHLKLGMTLQEMGITAFAQRLGVYLTNTLEEGIKSQPDLFSFGLAEAVSREADEAAVVKSERPIMVIVGNPPYSAVSSNQTSYANGLVGKYKVEPGGMQKLQERKNWLNDDYVKFIAFAEDMIAKNGEGIVAMITNHSYLDNPTFRGMRWHLARTFDSIHILDLHGSTKKNEKAPDGSKDDNVFDIQQGVAIMIAVKTGQKKSDAPAEVFHAELYGSRREKFTRLGSDPDWQPVTLDKKMYYFMPKDVTGLDDYLNGVSVSDLFMVGGLGVVTGRDSLTVDRSASVLLERVTDFAQLNAEEARRKYTLGKDSTTWKVAWAQANVLEQPVSGHFVVPIAYRPFDNRYCYYLQKSSGFIVRPNQKVMQQYLDSGNVGLMVCRQQKQPGFAHVLVHRGIVESSYVSNRTSEIGSSFPLYLYHDDGTRTPNFNIDVLKQLTKNLKENSEPEDVLDYVYAALYSPSYREKYKALLRRDFPRVPVPTGDEHFQGVAAIGRQLRELHLMASPLLDTVSTTFPIAGRGLVDKIKYADSRVWINDEQYIGEVPEVAWNFRVGGYQPAQKWLKDRKGSVLSSEDLDHYQRMVKALVETDKLMQEVDQVVAANPA